MKLVEVITARVEMDRSSAISALVSARSMARKSQYWRDWRSALVIVKPETVVAWHRADLRRFWTLGFNGYAKGDLCKHLVAKH